MDDFLTEAEAVAVKAAREGGGVLLSYYGKGHEELKIKAKGGDVRNPVTIADTRSNEVILQVILEKFPDHSIVSEENEPRRGNEFFWYVDPLDGTKNFSRGIGYFCVSVAMAKGNELLAACIYNPVTSELYTATKGSGAFRNNTELKVANTAEVHSAAVCCDLPTELSQRRLVLGMLERIVDVSSIRIKGSAALALCEVASGQADFYMNIGSNPWDFAAGALIVREAGGVVTDRRNREWRCANPARKGISAACSGWLLKELLGRTQQRQSGYRTKG